LALRNCQERSLKARNMAAFDPTPSVAAASRQAGLGCNRSGGSSSADPVKQARVGTFRLPGMRTVRKPNDAPKP